MIKDKARLINAKILKIYQIIKIRWKSVVLGLKLGTKRLDLFFESGTWINNKDVVEKYEILNTNNLNNIDRNYSNLLI